MPRVTPHRHPDLQMANLVRPPGKQEFPRKAPVSVRVPLFYLPVALIAILISRPCADNAVGARSINGIYGSGSQSLTRENDVR